MKNTISPLFFLFSATLGFSQVSNITLTSPGFLSTDASLAIFGTSDGDSGTLGLNIVANNLSSDPNSVTIGHEFTWYIANPCNMIGQAYATSQTQLFGNVVSSPSSIDLASTPIFYLGVWFDNDGNSSIDTNDVYGWAQFEYDGVNLNMIDSAVTTGSIKVVPEPRSIAILSLGSIAFLTRHRR